MTLLLEFSWIRPCPLFPIGYELSQCKYGQFNMETLWAGRILTLVGMGADAGGTGGRVPRFKIMRGRPPEIAIFADIVLSSWPFFGFLRFSK